MCELITSLYNYMQYSYKVKQIYVCKRIPSLFHSWKYFVIKETQNYILLIPYIFILTFKLILDYANVKCKTKAYSHMLVGA